MALYLNCHLTHNDCVFNRTCSTPIAYCSYFVLYCKLIAFVNFLLKKMMMMMSHYNYGYTVCRTAGASLVFACQA